MIGKMNNFKKITVFLSFFLIFALIFVNFSKIDKVYANSQPTNVSEINQILNDYYVANFEEIKNRTAGSSGEKNMANILNEFLTSNNFALLPGSESYIQNFKFGNESQSQNVIGYINNDSDKYVVIGAHYDSVYVGTKSYGYSDNFSGVAGVMNLALYLKNVDLDYNVIIAFYGAEEIGCVGSEYFVSNLAAAVRSNIMLSINFDSIGAGDYLYYYHSDFATKYGNKLNNLFDNNIKNAAGKIFSSLPANEINYYALGLNSDNSSYLKNGINALLFFAGNIEGKISYVETDGHDKIMHVTDSKETIDDIFGASFAENIAKTVDYAKAVIADVNESDYAPGQVNPAVYSDWVLKFSAIGVVIILFVGFQIFMAKKYKENKENYKLKKN